MRTTGAALLGLANGYNQYQTDSQDRQFELARRAYLLKSADTSTQLGDLNLAEKQREYNDQTALAQALVSASNPGLSTAPKQTPVQQPQAPAPAPQPAAPSWTGPEPTGQFAGDPAMLAAQISRIKDPADRASAMRVLQNQVQAQGGASDPKGELQKWQNIATNSTDPAARAQANNAALAIRTTLAQKGVQQIDDQVQGPAKEGETKLEAAKQVGSPAPTAPVANLYERQADTYSRAAEAAMNNPALDAGTRARVAVQLQTKAEEATKKSYELRKTAQQVAEADTKRLGVMFASLGTNPTKENYDNIQSVFGNDPVYKDIASKLKLTGVFDTDFNKLAQLAHMGMSANQVSRADLQASGQELTLLGKQMAAAKLEQSAAINRSKGIATPPALTAITGRILGATNAKQAIGTEAAQAPQPQPQGQPQPQPQPQPQGLPQGQPQGQPQPEPQNRFQLPENPADLPPGMSKDAIIQAATKMRITGDLPNAVKTNPYALNLIRSQAEQMRQDSGVSAKDELAQQANNKVMMSSMPTFQKMMNGVEANAKSAMAALDLVEKAFDKVQNSGLPVANNSLHQLQTKFSDNPDLQVLMQRIQTFAPEYGKVMSGAYGAAGNTDTMNAKAEGLLSHSMGPKSVKAVIASIRQEVALRKQSLEDARAEMFGKAGYGDSAQATSTPAPAPSSKVIDFGSLR